MPIIDYIIGILLFGVIMPIFNGLKYKCELCGVEAIVWSDRPFQFLNYKKSLPKDWKIAQFGFQVCSACIPDLEKYYADRKDYEQRRTDATKHLWKAAHDAAEAFAKENPYPLLKTKT